MSLLFSLAALVAALMCWRTSQEISHHVIELECKVDDLMKMRVKPTPRQYVAVVKGHHPPTITIDAQSEAEALRRLLAQRIAPKNIVSLEVAP